MWDFFIAGFHACLFRIICNVIWNCSMFLLWLWKFKKIRSLRSSGSWWNPKYTLWVLKFKCFKNYLLQSTESVWGEVDFLLRSLYGAMVLCFWFVTNTVLITHCCFGSCWTVLAQHQGTLLLICLFVCFSHSVPVSGRWSQHQKG